MSLLSVDELKTLVEQPKGLCVSIYMPIYQGAEINQNPIRFKNLMLQAEELLEENGLSSKEAQELLQPAQEEADSSENLKPEELKLQAWEIVEPLFLQEQQSAIDHYKELTATGLTSTDIKEAVPAAYYGRVEQLFVAVGVQQWGSFDPNNNTIDLHCEAELGDEDLLDSAAIQTILNGGTVYAVEPGNVPDEALLAAVFRY
jgi:hypothetical protein